MKATLSFQKKQSRMHVANFTLLIALALCALLPSGLKAQQIVTIGTETGTSYEVPVNNYWNYTWSQMIFTSQEIPAGTISAIGFQYAYSSPSTAKNNVRIYFATTNKSYFSSESDYVTSGFTLVYSGNLNCSQGWNTFNLQTPYAYSGNGNLVVAVVDQSGDYDGRSYTFNQSSTSNAMTIHYYEDDYSASSPTSPNSNMYSDYIYYRANTQFTILSPCA